MLQTALHVLADVVILPARVCVCFYLFVFLGVAIVAPGLVSVKVDCWS